MAAPTLGGSVVSGAWTVADPSMACMFSNARVLSPSTAHGGAPGTLVFAGLQPDIDLLVLFFFFSSFFSSGSLDQRGRRD
jgi:hypothetical protein